MLRRRANTNTTAPANKPNDSNVMPAVFTTLDGRVSVLSFGLKLLPALVVLPLGESDADDPSAVVAYSSRLVSAGCSTLIGVWLVEVVPVDGVVSRVRLLELPDETTVVVPDDVPVGAVELVVVCGLVVDGDDDVVVVVGVLDGEEDVVVGGGEGDDEVAGGGEGAGAGAALVAQARVASVVLPDFKL